MDEPDAARTKQIVWELVSPLFDRLDQFQHDLRELRQRVQACEAELKRAPGASPAPAMLPPSREEG